MIFIKIITDKNGGISLKGLNKSEVNELEKSHERGKWYVIAIGKGKNPKNSMRQKDLPKKLQQQVRIALNVLL